MYFGVRRERDLYLVDYFESMVQDYPNLSFKPILSQETQSGAYAFGFVTDAIAMDLSDLDGWKTYMAGPPAMIDAAGALLQERGLRTEDAHVDVFFTPEETTLTTSYFAKMETAL